METPTPPEHVARLHAALQRADPPTALELRVRRQITQARERRARRRRTAVGVFATVGALGASAGFLVLPHGSPPTVVEVVRLAAVAPRVAAPPVDRTDRRRLAARVDDVSFPSWRSLGWRSVGRSSQTIAGHRAETVYYARDDGAHIAYTIVAAGTLPWPRGTRAVTRGWAQLRVYWDGGRRVIGWRKLGHQCLIAGSLSLPEETLLALAAGDA